MKHNWDEAPRPHRGEVSPAGAASNPRDAGVKGVPLIMSPTDDQPPPRQEGEAVVKPFFRHIRDGAGVGAREQLHACLWEDAIPVAARHHLP